MLISRSPRFYLRRQQAEPGPRNERSSLGSNFKIDLEAVEVKLMQAKEPTANDDVNIVRWLMSKECQAVKPWE